MVYVYTVYMVATRCRAKTGPSGMRMAPTPGEPSRCFFEWVLNMDLKLPISDRVLNGLIVRKLKQSMASLHVRLNETRNVIEL